MTDLPATPPTRSRRRITVVIVVLSLASLGTWWYWPRGDTRLIGKWQFHFAANDNPADVNIVQLNRNGTGESVIPGVIRMPFTWHVHENRLVMDSPIQNESLATVVNSFLHFIASKTKYESSRSTFELIEIGTNRIRMRDTREPDLELLLIREPE